MPQDLTASRVDRQNILNNQYAIAEIEKAITIKAVAFECRSWLLKEQIAVFFEMTPRTIDNYIDKYDEEIRQK